MDFYGFTATGGKKEEGQLFISSSYERVCVCVCEIQMAIKALEAIQVTEHQTCQSFLHTEHAHLVPLSSSVTL